MIQTRSADVLGNRLGRKVKLGFGFFAIFMTILAAIIDYNALKDNRLQLAPWSVIGLHLIEAFGFTLLLSYLLIYSTLKWGTSQPSLLPTAKRLNDLINFLFFLAVIIGFVDPIQIKIFGTPLGVFMLAFFAIASLLSFQIQLHTLARIDDMVVEYYESLETPFRKVTKVMVFKPDSERNYKIGIFLTAGKKILNIKVPLLAKYISYDEFLSFPSNSYRYPIYDFSILILKSELENHSVRKHTKEHQGLHLGGFLKQSLSWYECRNFLEELKEEISFQVICPFDEA